MSKRDPFTGTWMFRPEKSRSAGQTPGHWILTILVEGNEITVKEETATGGSPQPTISIQAGLDGESYAVSGSPAADHVAYQRTGERSLSGIAYKDGKTSLRETLTVSASGDELCMEYTIYLSVRDVSGTAVFQRLDQEHSSFA